MPKSDNHESEKKSEPEIIDDEPSFYFYEDDEDELANLIDVCEPILAELEI